MLVKVKNGRKRSPYSSCPLFDSIETNFIRPLESLSQIGKKSVLPIKESAINNRRYLGNKYRLLRFISQTIRENCVDVRSFADIFCGTGAVASAFIDKELITNDILFSNYICNFAWFSPTHYRAGVVTELIRYFNSLEVDEENYMTFNFSDTFFCRQDCSKIGYIRESIECLYKNGEIAERERAILVTSLLYAMDKIANTCGHYDAYRQGVCFDKHLELTVLRPSIGINKNNKCFNIDANELVSNIAPDIVYIDPPYNSRQYCDVYHLLENVARWEQPDVYGVARKMDRSLLKSDYCTSKAPKAFARLIHDINARYILLSYNNMGQKGNGRSNAKISDDTIRAILSKRGKVEEYSFKHRAFSTGKSKIEDNEERLFFVRVIQ